MPKSRQRLQAFAENAEQTARRQRDIQKEVGRTAAAARDKKSRAMQAGATTTVRDNELFWTEKFIVPASLNFMRRRSACRRRR
jgi:hypothetical protein